MTTGRIPPGIGLQHPERDHALQVPGQPAERGEDRESGQRDVVDPGRPEPVGEPAADRHHHAERQLVGRGHPLDLVGGHAEVVLHGQDGHVDDADVQHRHEHAGDQHDQRQAPTAGRRGAVRSRVGRRRDGARRGLHTPSVSRTPIGPRRPDCRLSDAPARTSRRPAVGGRIASAKIGRPARIGSPLPTGSPLPGPRARCPLPWSAGRPPGTSRAPCRPACQRGSRWPARPTGSAGAGSVPGAVLGRARRGRSGRRRRGGLGGRRGGRRSTGGLHRPGAQHQREHHADRGEHRGDDEQLVQRGDEHLGAGLLVQRVGAGEPGVRARADVRQVRGGGGASSPDRSAEQLGLLGGQDRGENGQTERRRGPLHHVVDRAGAADHGRRHRRDAPRS